MSAQVAKSCQLQTPPLHLSALLVMGLTKPPSATTAPSQRSWPLAHLFLTLVGTLWLAYQVNGVYASTVTCPPGYNLTDDHNHCQCCSPGYYSPHVGTLCQPCPAYTHQPNYCGTSCPTCLANDNQLAYGGQSCVPGLSSFHTRAEDCTYALFSYKPSNYYLHCGYGGAYVLLGVGCFAVVGGLACWMGLSIGTPNSKEIA